MSEAPQFNRDDNLADIVERIRVQQFPEVDRDLMLAFLQLHAEGDRPENLTRKIDEALAASAQERS
jgi:hypothetical protein